MNKKTKSFLINIGSGKDMSKVKIKFDKSKPDGVPKKLLDTSLAKKYGWKSKIPLDKGFEITYKSFLKNYK